MHQRPFKTMLSQPSTIRNGLQQRAHLLIFRGRPYAVPKPGTTMIHGQLRVADLSPDTEARDTTTVPQEMRMPHCPDLVRAANTLPDLFKAQVAAVT